MFWTRIYILKKPNLDIVHVWFVVHIPKDKLKMQFRSVLDAQVVDVEKRRNPSKHYVSIY